MALREYRHNGGTYQFEDDDAPEGAEPITGDGEKERKPRDKSGSPKTKTNE